MDFSVFPLRCRSTVDQIYGVFKCRSQDRNPSDKIFPRSFEDTVARPRRSASSTASFPASTANISRGTGVRTRESNPTCWPRDLSYDATEQIVTESLSQ